MIYQKTIHFETQGREILEITTAVLDLVKQSGIDRGLCHLFILHTSASLTICEHADPLVRDDLERFMQRLIPDGDSIYLHNDEGPDDMPSHIRTVLTQSGLTIPVNDQKLILGQWQGVYLWEHRHKSHIRYISVTIIGEKQ